MIHGDHVATFHLNDGLGVSWWLRVLRYGHGFAVWRWWCGSDARLQNVRAGWPGPGLPCVTRQSSNFGRDAG